MNVPVKKKSQQFVLLVIFVIFLIYFWSNLGQETTTTGPINNWYDCDGCGRRYRQIIVHLDLKGAPVKVEFLIKWIELVKKFNATAILIEYEDMFPYEGFLRNISRSDHYSEEDLKKILRKAHELDLEIIPLIQSFGHVEFILKHEEFSILREFPAESNSICPSDDRSIALIKEIIHQMRESHPFSKRIHIGADEVYHLAEDYRCRLRIMKEKLTSSDLKLAHIANVASAARSAGFSEVLVWNDMFDKEPEQVIKRAGLDRLVTPVVWGYRTDVTEEGYFPEGVLNRIYKTFDNFLVASAFKGANGKSIQTMDIARYMATHRSYKKLLDQYSQEAEKCSGMIVTGWSRYKHFFPLCELLPTATPSLLIALDYFQNENATNVRLWDRLQKHLECPAQNDRIFDPESLIDCDFLGVDLYKMMNTQWAALEATAQRINKTDPEAVRRVNVATSRFLEELKPVLEEYIYQKDTNELLGQMQRELISLLN